MKPTFVHVLLITIGVVGNCYSQETSTRQRATMCESIIAHELAIIRKCYSQGRPFVNRFQQSGVFADSDCLSVWTSSRLDLTDDEACSGQLLLKAFATNRLPRAYGNYEKKRMEAIELQEVFNEEFPEPWNMKSSNPRFDKILERFAKARIEYFVCHDELCYYWLLNRLGILKDYEWQSIDARPLSVMLLSENVRKLKFTSLDVIPLSDGVREFAEKYATGSYQYYQKIYKASIKLDVMIDEIEKERLLLDDVRFSRALGAAYGMRNDLVRELNILSQLLENWQLDFRAQEKTSEEITHNDAKQVEKLKPFLGSLRSYLRVHTLGPVIPDSDLVPIPGYSFCLQRTETTQLQWMIVMGRNPSKHKGPDLPVENVSWEDCQEFIREVGAMDGRVYRLPSEREWSLACRAGSISDFGIRMNGIGRVDDCGDRRHPVAMNEPNALGIYDMYGNVHEWCSDLYSAGKTRRSDGHSYRGWCFKNGDSSCPSESLWVGGAGDRSDMVGLRLAK